MKSEDPKYRDIYYHLYSSRVSYEKPGEILLLVIWLVLWRVAAKKLGY